jgi:hypothetical protein
MDKPIYLAVDIEALGGTLGVHPITQIGAAIIDGTTGQLLDIDEPVFQTYIFNNDGLKAEERCVKEFWMKEENEAHYEEMVDAIKNPLKSLSKEDAARSFQAWAQDKLDAYSNVTVVTDTCGFDIGGLNWLLGHNDGNMIYLLHKPGSDTELRYTPQVDVDSFAEGIYRGHGLKRKRDENTYNCAFRALSCKAPVIPYIKSHMPSDDAAFIGSMYCELNKACDKKQYEKTKEEED